jgi:hypothetical protein
MTQHPQFACIAANQDTEHIGKHKEQKYQEQAYMQPFARAAGERKATRTPTTNSKQTSLFGCRKLRSGNLAAEEDALHIDGNRPARVSHGRVKGRAAS